MKAEIQFSRYTKDARQHALSFPACRAGRVPAERVRQLPVKEINNSNIDYNYN